METISTLHAIAGIIVGLTGLVQIIFKKGGKYHRLIGLLYSFSWVIVVSTGAVMGSIFISLLGILGLYMVVTGYRFAHIKKSAIALFDRVTIISGVAIASALFISGPVIFFLGKNQMLAIICTFFGLIFFITTFQDLAVFVLQKKKKRTHGFKLEWMYEHYTRMYISYIAAITAFSAIQNIFGIALINWILPTVIGTLLIILTGKFYDKKKGISERG